MPVPKHDHVATMAEQILGHAVDALNQDGLPGPPDRQFVSHGEAPWDCELLAVYLGTLSTKPLGRGDPNYLGICATIPKAQFGVQLVRCASTQKDGVAPEPATLDAEAQARLVDAWALWMWLTGCWASGTLVDGVSCQNVTFDSLVPVPPSGGFAGLRMLLTIQIPVSGEIRGS